MASRVALPVAAPTYLFAIVSNVRHSSTLPCFIMTHGLTLKQLGWYLNFSALSMKNVLFEQKEIKL
jgi:hypothetical protein